MNLNDADAIMGHLSGGYTARIDITLKTHHEFTTISVQSNVAFHLHLVSRTIKWLVVLVRSRGHHSVCYYQKGMPPHDRLLRKHKGRAPVHLPLRVV